jgi:hypothetical protein
MSEPNDIAVLSNTSNSDRDEGVLSDVLDELDRERLRRAELEAEIRKLHEDNETLRKSQQQRQGDSSSTISTGNVSQRLFIAMETQVKGYQELVDALTVGKPAISAAAAEEEALLKKKKMMAVPMHRFGVNEHQRDANAPAKRKTLPLHVVRLLELLPWDAKSKQHIFAVEEVFEWQTYQEGTWQSQLQYFPPFFKSLPLIKAEASNSKNLVDDRLDDQNYEAHRNIDDKKDNRNFLQFLAGADIQRKQNKYRIFTDSRVTVIYDLDAGYPLPSNDGGVWEWVGSWRISSRTTTGSVTESLDNHEKVDSDQSGWSYVVEPRDFLLGLKDMVWDNPGIFATTGNKPTRFFRRRRWTRQRVLIDYLSASESTKQYLKLLSENARLSLSASKISEQLIETKVMLTETEEKLAHANDLLRIKSSNAAVSGENQPSSLPLSTLNEIATKSTTVQQSSEIAEKIVEKS